MATYSRHIAPPVQKSPGQQFKEDAVYFIVIIGVYYLLAGIGRILVAPFKVLFTSDKEKFASKLEIAKAKVKARKAYRQMNNNEDLLEQYLERFKYHPERYRNDPENEVINDCYEAWKNGKLLDSALIYAPDIYVKDYQEKNFFNEAFLNYLQKQIDLHLNDTRLARHHFLETVRKYYPEFTPKFSIMPDEIKEYRERAKAPRLQMELIDELEKQGIPTDLGVELVNSNSSPEAIKSKIAIVKNCLEQNFGYNTCRYFAMNDTGIDPKDPLAKTVNLILENIGVEGIATALIKGDITPEELQSITDRIIEQKNEAIRNNTYDGRDQKYRDRIEMSFRRLMKEKVTHSL